MLFIGLLLLTFGLIGFIWCTVKLIEAILKDEEGENKNEL